jgi:hypothetical protein
MALQIIFGWYLDGPSFPETSDGSKSTLGKLIAGPAALINQLALRSGLVRPLIPQAVRIANYLAALREVDNGKQPYSASFGIDAWSTASYLLVLRDELVANGWSPDKHSDLGTKVESLAGAEAVAQNIAGVADLTRAVMSCVESSRRSFDLSSIELVTARERLPSSWQKLLEQLALNGTNINQRAASPAAPRHSDLGKVQRMFNGAESAQLSNDGTFTLLEADDEVQASEALAAYLAADTNKNREIVLIRGANTALLDEACSVQDLPRIGGEVKSRWRSIPQLLPLAIGNRWNPPDPLILLEFLSLPLLPIPRDVSYRFARALRSEPGFGGAQWHEAWSQALRENKAHHGSEGTECTIQGNQNHFESELRFWLLPARFDPYEGIPAHELIALSRRIQRWASQKAHGDTSTTSEMLMELHGLCKCFEETVKAVALSRVTRAQVNRILDAVYKDGIAAPGTSAEAATWTHVDQPGQVWSEASTIIWWGCVGNRSERFHFPWTSKEIDALKSAGLILEHPAAETLRDADGWRRCLLNTKDAFFMVAPRVSLGEPNRQHPFLTEFFARFRRINSLPAPSIIRQAHELYESSSLHIAMRNLMRDEIELVALPTARKDWHVQSGIIEPRAEESASSLELLLGCPMAWTLRYKAQMHPGSVLSVPQAGELIGHLLHSCIHKLYSEKTDWTPEPAARRIGKLFDEQIGHIALPLLLPGRMVERTHVKKALCDAIFDFQTMVCNSGFHVLQTEVRQRTSLLGGELVGQIDLILQDEKSRQYVVDFKWAKNLKYKRDEMKQGHHLQLAIYATLQRIGENIVDAGYYMLKQKRLLSATSLLFPSEDVGSPITLEGLWNNAIATCKTEFEALSNGVVCARGIESLQSEQDLLPLPLIPAPCKFCDYESICGKKSNE